VAHLLHIRKNTYEQQNHTKGFFFLCKTVTGKETQHRKEENLQRMVSNFNMIQVASTTTEP